VNSKNLAVVIRQRVDQVPQLLPLATDLGESTAVEKFLRRGMGVPENGVTGPTAELRLSGKGWT